MIFAKLFSFLFSFWHIKCDCLTGKCEKISFEVHRDAVLDSEFVGHVFHNSVTLNPVQCYMWCIHDCRCLSFNYKENNDTKYCELNDGSHFTNNNSLKHSQWSRYYNLRREYQVLPEWQQFCIPCHVLMTWLTNRDSVEFRPLRRRVFQKLLLKSRTTSEVDVSKQTRLNPCSSKTYIRHHAS